MTSIITFSYSLKSFLGLIPSTNNFEKKQIKLLTDYKRINALNDDSKITRFVELREWVGSGEMKKRKNQINSQKYNESEECKKEKSFKKLKKSSQIRTYYKIKDSEKLDFYRLFKDSEKLAEYLKQKEYFSSNNFTDDKAKIKIARADKLKSLNEKKALYKSEKKNLNWFFKLQKRTDFKLFIENRDSEQWKAFLSLADEVEKIDLVEVKKKIAAEHRKIAKDYYSLKKRFKQLRKEEGIAKKKKKDFLKHEEYAKVKLEFENSRNKNKVYKINYKETVEFKKVKEYKAKKKEKIIKACLKYSDKSQASQYFKTSDSEQLKKYLDLKEYFTNAFKNDLSEAKKETYKNSGLFKEYKIYKKLKCDAEIKRYKKLAKSKKIATYQNLEGSDLIKEYESLKEYVAGKDFLDKKKYLKIRDKFKLSDEYKDFLEYKKLRKDSDVKWFVKNEKTKRFDELKKWKMIFSEEFDAKSLDIKKWLTVPLSGKQTNVGTFSQKEEKQAFDDKSIKLDGGNLLIETKKEKTKGKTWHPQFGFIPKDFDFVSGTINTGDLFNYKYGRVEVKLKMSGSKNVEQGVYLSSINGDKQISILHGKKIKKSKKAYLGVVSGNLVSAKNMLSSFCFTRFSKQFNILSLDWNSKQIVWRVNGEVIGGMEIEIPNEEMYL
ncbi:MAG: family 16 glycosylhydrolase, partial [Bacteroidota bacterium]|nr:family 16 glycosylhydrolase [Bacteroidota bacterium]